MSANAGHGNSRLVLATANPHKAAEITRLLDDSGWLVLPRPPEVPEVEESAETLAGNAALKAAALARATGLPALADDTGLFVHALAGAPGVRSARFAGDSATYDDNVDKLLACLAGTLDRRATFRTVALLCTPSGDQRWVEGTCEGCIARSRAGGHGFGYDPVFEPAAGDGRTFAEMSEEEKDALSQRARALSGLRRLARLAFVPCPAQQGPPAR